eukprot:1072710-Karenia_brevis.AAC.1
MSCPRRPTLPCASGAPHPLVWARPGPVVPGVVPGACARVAQRFVRAVAAVAEAVAPGVVARDGSGTGQT